MSAECRHNGTMVSHCVQLFPCETCSEISILRSLSKIRKDRREFRALRGPIERPQSSASDGQRGALDRINEELARRGERSASSLGFAPNRSLTATASMRDVSFGNRFCDALTESFHLYTTLSIRQLAELTFSCMSSEVVEMHRRRPPWFIYPSLYVKALS